MLTSWTSIVPALFAISNGFREEDDHLERDDD